MDSGLLTPEKKSLTDEILIGLTNRQKYLPSKLFYDKRGSELFDQICELEEYYPTRTELKIMRDNIKEIASLFDSNTLFIEFGSGSSLKTRLLLDNIDVIAGYVPIDISEEHLNISTRKLKDTYPRLNIVPLAADYTKPLEFPQIHKPVDNKIAFFPGSTIGNFTNQEAEKFLEIVANDLGDNGGLIIGVDLAKDKSIIEKAYNDKKGITAEFNLNILRRINNEFSTDFNLANFEHLAFFNEKESRIEMHLISKVDQLVNLEDDTISFRKGESILTEYSHKYTLESFDQISRNYFTINKVWIDPDKYFAVIYLSGN